MVLLLVLLPCCDWAKGKTDSVRAAYKSENSFAIKGKIWPWPLFFTAVQVGVGAEYGFKHKYAVQLEAEASNVSFPNDTDEHVGPRMNREYAGFVLTFKKYTGTSLYWAAFARYGTFNLGIEKGYKTDTISYHQSQYSAGLLLGFAAQCGKRSTLELNFGPFVKQVDGHNIYHQDNIIVDKRLNYMKFGVRFDAIFSRNLKLKSKHLMVP